MCFFLVYSLADSSSLEQVLNVDELLIVTMVMKKMLFVCACADDFSSICSLMLVNELNRHLGKGKK